MKESEAGITDCMIKLNLTVVNAEEFCCAICIKSEEANLGIL